MNIINKKETKHYSPANKEWKNSMYSYNKNTVKETVIKDNNLNKLIKSHFNLSLNTDNNKSRRMRNLIKRSFTKKVFVSKPEIKQTSDKYIVTVYIYDRENQLLKRKLFLLYRSLNDNNFILKEKSFFYNKFFELKKNLHNNSLYSLNLKNILANKKKYLRRKHTLLSKAMNNYKVRYNIISKHILPIILNKRIWLKEYFNYLFLKWSLYNIGIIINEQILCPYCKKVSDKNTMKNFTCFNCKTVSNQKWNFVNIYKNNIIIYTLYIDKEIKLITLNNKMKNLLTKHFSVLISNNNINKIIAELFKKYKKIVYKDFINHFFIIEYKLLKLLSNINLNRFKMNNFIPHIKELASDIYNKTTEFNIINLKYLHLNSDNLLEAISIKLKKRKSRLLRILGKSLKLVKMPKSFPGLLDKFKCNVKSKNYTRDSILMSVRYKWITGIRLEAKGRLTRRFTASRALFKYVNKGNLKNMDNIYKPIHKLETPSVYVLRGQYRPNLQHSYVYSNKRIGTFGLKGWISSI